QPEVLPGGVRPGVALAGRALRHVVEQRLTGRPDHRDDVGALPRRRLRLRDVLVDVPGRDDQVDPRHRRVGGGGNHPVPFGALGIDPVEAFSYRTGGRFAGRVGVCPHGQAELDQAAARVDSQRAQVGITAGEQRVPSWQGDAVLEPDRFADRVGEPVHPRHPVLVRPVQAGQPQHGSLHRHRGVRPGQVRDRLPGQPGQLAGPGDERRIEVQLAGHDVTRRSNSCRTDGVVRMRSSAKSAWPGTYPFPTSMVTSAASPSAPRAAALKLVAMEKKITVPPCFVDRIAPPSQPATSTHTTVTSAGPPAASTRLANPTGSLASAITISSTRGDCGAAGCVAGRGRLCRSSLAVGIPPAPSSCVVARSRSKLASASLGTTPMILAAPAWRAAAADREPLFPAAPTTSTTGPSTTSAPFVTSAPSTTLVAFAPFVTTRLVRAGAPQTSMTASVSSADRSSGSTAAMERANRMAWPSQGTCSDWPSQAARPSVIWSGVRVRETRVATRWPGVRPSGELGPTSSTVPVSIPPLPVTGFCILPRVVMMSRTARRILSGSAEYASRSWR